VLTGFPWNLLAHVWAFDPAPMQFASIVGVYGLSVFTALFATLPATFIAGRVGRISAIAGIMIAVLLWGGGAIRLSLVGPATADATVSDDLPVIQVVQPNIPQREKWIPELQDQHFAKLLRLSRRPVDMAPDLKRIVIWPETAATFFVEAQPVRRLQMASVLGPDDILITGAPRTYPRDTNEFKVWNAVQVLDSNGEIVASFDKFHLVPFGEYVPLREWIPIPKLTAGRTDFSFGEGPQTLEVAGTRSFSRALLLTMQISLTGCSMLPMTGGLAKVLVRISIWQQHGSAASKKADRWCARPIQAYRECMTPMVGNWQNSP
jgi:apolipoprotein N-acyltransferase